MNQQEVKRLFGLIGYPLSHSFSRKFFSEKFQNEGLHDHAYRLFPLESIDGFPALFDEYANWVGLNVTLPYKEQVIPFLDRLSPEAEEIGAVNTIRLNRGIREGFNTDVYGFEKSLLDWAPREKLQAGTALVLGTGGASKAVCFGLKKLNVPFRRVSRSPHRADLTYEQLEDVDWEEVRLVVNTTPVGMYPRVSAAPALPYERLGPGHYLFDLVYNPEKPLFLQKGEKQGCFIQNGLKMLYLQAEKAWEIWTE